MRPSKFLLLSTLSVLALMTATSATEALALPAVDAGLLKMQAKGTPYHEVRQLLRRGKSGTTVIPPSDETAEAAPAMPVPDVEKSSLTAAPEQAAEIDPISPEQRKQAVLAVEKSLQQLQGIEPAAEEDAAPIEDEAQKIAEADAAAKAKKIAEKDAAEAAKAAKIAEADAAAAAAKAKKIAEAEAAAAAKAQKIAADEAAAAVKAAEISVQQQEEQAAKIDARDKQDKVLQVALKAKEQELLGVKHATKADDKRLAAVRTTLASFSPERTIVYQELQPGVNEEPVQETVLQKQVEQQIPKHNETIISVRKEPVVEVPQQQTPADTVALVAPVAEPVVEQPLQTETPKAADTVALLEPSAGIPEGGDVPVKDFLDRIMAYHRTGGEVPRPADVKPVKLGAAAPVVVAEKVAADKEPVEKLAENPEMKLPARLLQQAEQVAEMESGVAGALTLENLLHKSGMAVRDYTPSAKSADAAEAQWIAGKIRGMYEQNAIRGEFNGQVNAYLDRYRQDCGPDLKVGVTLAETSNAGIVATADIACVAPSNSYTNTFLFLQDVNGFNVFTHTAYPADSAEAVKARDALERTLRAAEGFVAPQIPKQSASAMPPGFGAPVEVTDILETVVVQ